MESLQPEDSRVAVIIPAFNVAPYIEQTVRSVLDQNLPVELIIVDDGSPDDIPAAIESAAAHCRYFRKPNGGVATARNFGHRQIASNARYLLFLDGDDVLKPGSLRKMVQYLDTHKDVGMLHCEAEVIDEHGELSEIQLPVVRWGFGPRAIPPSDPVTPFESIYTLSFIIPSLSLLRRSVFEETGGYDESFGHNMEDADLHLRMALRAPVHFLAEKLVQYRLRPGQATRDNASLRQQARKLWQKWANSPALSAAERTLVARCEYLLHGPLGAFTGFEAARKCWKARDWWNAFRFWQGAARRLLHWHLFARWRS